MWAAHTHTQHTHTLPQLDYHPSSASDATPFDVERFARSWLNTWATLACLPNFSDDLRGRLLLDLLNEPDATGGGRGVHWQRDAWSDGRGNAGSTPGLDELYLAAMDAIETLTPGDALFMVQGSVRTRDAAPDGRHLVAGVPLSTGKRCCFLCVCLPKCTPHGLCSQLPPTLNTHQQTKKGDGFTTDAAAIAAQRLYDPAPFFNELLLRPYKGRTLLAPHLYGPSLPGGSTATVRASEFGVGFLSRPPARPPSLLSHLNYQNQHTPKKTQGRRAARRALPVLGRPRVARALRPAGPLPALPCGRRRDGQPPRERRRHPVLRVGAALYAPRRRGGGGRHGARRGLVLVELERQQQG